MSIIKPIDYADIVNSIDVYHFGWSEGELAVYRKQYHSEYYGNINDSPYEIIDEEGNIYYAIFRSAAEDEWFVRKSKDYLLFKDKTRVLLNIGGQLYRYLIKEKRLLNNLCYEGIIYNDYGKPNSPYFHSISSPSHEIMIIVDRDGIAAINWEGILWRGKFEWAHCGHLELLSIDGCHVIANYEDSMEGNLYLVSYDILNGKYEMKPCKRRE